MTTHTQPSLLTVGDLRRACAGLPDDARIQLEWEYSGTVAAAPALYAYEQASDAVPPPVGTDPETEATVGVLIIGSDETDPLVSRA